MEFKKKIATELENKTVDKIIKPDTRTYEQLMDDLFSDDFYSDDLYNDVKTKITENDIEIGEDIEKVSDNEGVENGEVESKSLQEQTLNSFKGGVDVKEKEHLDENSVFNQLPPVKGELVKADEIKPELVKIITDTVVEKIHTEQKGKLLEIVQGRVIHQEEWYKLIIWKYFPVIGIPIYLMLLLLLSFNMNNKYDPTLVNFARAEIKTFWIYAIAHIVVVFTCCAAVLSLINIIHRGLIA